MKLPISKMGLWFLGIGAILLALGWSGNTLDQPASCLSIPCFSIPFPLWVVPLQLPGALFLSLNDSSFAINTPRTYLRASLVNLVVFYFVGSAIEWLFRIRDGKASISAIKHKQ
jgi:hypothetical protein